MRPPASFRRALRTRHVRRAGKARIDHGPAPLVLEQVGVDVAEAGEVDGQLGPEDPGGDLGDDVVGVLLFLSHGVPLDVTMSSRPARRPVPTRLLGGSKDGGPEMAELFDALDGCRRAPGATPPLLGAAAAVLGVPALGQLLDRGHVDRPVVQVVLDVGQPLGEEPPVGADAVAAERDRPGVGGVLLDEGQGGGAGFFQRDRRGPDLLGAALTWRASPARRRSWPRGPRRAGGSPGPGPRPRSPGRRRWPAWRSRRSRRRPGRGRSSPGPSR